MASSRESLNFSTAEPILAGRFFAPNRWDDLLDYSSVLININSIGAGTKLTIYQSSNQVNISSEQEINISDGELYSNSFQLYARFFKLRLDNPDLTDQTALNCQVIFRQNYVPAIANGTGTDVNITNTQIPVSQYGSWSTNTVITNADPIAITGVVEVNNFPEIQDVNITNGAISVSGTVDATILNESLDVNVSNFPATQVISGTVSVDNIGSLAPLTNYLGVQVMNDEVPVGGFILSLSLTQLQGINANVAVMNPKLDTIVSNSNTLLTRTAKGNGTLWNAVSTGVNGVSTSLNLSNSAQQNITFFGNVSSATTLTVQFSLNGTNWYSSQYSYTTSTGGDIGFNVQCSVYYVRLLSTNDVNATIYASYN